MDKEDLEEITVLEYGQYALISKVANYIKRDLEGCFTFEQAAQIMSFAIILYAGFAHLDQTQEYYDQSWLSLEYKPY